MRKKRPPQLILQGSAECKNIIRDQIIVIQYDEEVRAKGGERSWMSRLWVSLPK